MKPGPGKVLPGPCTLAEEARAAIETIERQYPIEAGLIQRMADTIKQLQESMIEVYQVSEELADNTGKLRCVIRRSDDAIEA